MLTRAPGLQMRFQVLNAISEKIRSGIQAAGLAVRSYFKPPGASNFEPFKPTNFKLDVPPVCTNLFLNARNTSNIGDLMSSPYDYFTLPGESATADFWSRVNAGEEHFDNIIVGGGVFWKNYVRIPMYYHRLRPRKNLILWGVGIDTPAAPPMPADFTDRCALIGTRDFAGASVDGEKVVFCPCASAMNRAFDLPRPPSRHKVICFLHHNKKLAQSALFAAYPKMNNYAEFTDTLDFLASGEVVITDSYHGLYWATLLGKKVICLEGGGKFALFKWTPAYVKPEAYREILADADEIPSYPGALSECRELNIAFYEKVLAIIAS